jgi:hypothetical protein
LLVVDPLPLLADGGDPSDLFIPYDRMHLSARGNARMADAAAEILRGRLESVRSHSDEAWRK